MKIPRRKSDEGRRIKTENYFFFVPFGLKLIFTVLERLVEWGVDLSTQKSCGGVGGKWEKERVVKGARWIGFCHSFSEKSAPMILNVNEGIKFLFLFYFHIVFLFPAPHPLLLLCAFQPRTEYRPEKNVGCSSRDRWNGFFYFAFPCASAEKYGFGKVLVFFSLLFKRKSSPNSILSSAQHDTK